MAKNSSKQWTREEDQRLLQLHAAGKSRIRLPPPFPKTRINPGAPVHFKRANDKGRAHGGTFAMTDQQLLISTVREAGRIIAEHLEADGPDAAHRSRFWTRGPGARHRSSGAGPRIAGGEVA
jgi:hypothetical protein